MSRLVLILLLLAAPVSADVRFVLLPLETVGTAPRIRQTPKYISRDTQVPPRWTFLPTAMWTSLTNGGEPQALVEVDMAPADLATLIAAPDVIAMPENLETTITKPDLARLQPQLDVLQVPNDLLGATPTWATFVTSIRGMFLFKQRVRGILGASAIAGGYTLDTPIGNLPPAAREALTVAADDLRFTKGRLTPADTVRDLLKDIARQNREQDRAANPGRGRR